MESPSIVLTYRDYAALPDDGRRYELHDGAVSVTPTPGTRHQRISRNLFVLLQRHVETRRLGEVLYAPFDVILSDRTVLQPDIVYFDDSRLPLLSARGAEGPPTLVVEIISASTGTIDRVTKPSLYARHGVPFLGHRSGGAEPGCVRARAGEILTRPSCRRRFARWTAALSRSRIDPRGALSVGRPGD